MNIALEAVLRRDRLVVASCLLLVSALGWVYVLAGAGMGMSGIEMTRHSLMDMDLMAPATWTPAYVVLMFFMWWIMMIAMMLPSATPAILLAAALNRRHQDPAPYGSSAFFTSGYLLAWAAFSIVAVAIQWGLQETGLISGMLRSRSDAFSAALLAAAGAWQFSPWKQTCLRHCRGPLEFLTRHRHPGNSGALLMGARHGLYCLTCCWFLMVLLFAGGVMNLLWIAGLALYVWIEKVLPGGMVVSRITGGLLIGWAAAILLLN